MKELLICAKFPQHINYIYYKYTHDLFICSKGTRAQEHLAQFEFMSLPQAFCTGLGNLLLLSSSGMGRYICKIKVKPSPIFGSDPLASALVLMELFRSLISL